MITLDGLIEDYMVEQPSMNITDYIVARCWGSNISEMDYYLKYFLEHTNNKEND